MDFEVLNTGMISANPLFTNSLCPGTNGICPGVNAACPGVNGACSGVNASCGVDSNCPNVFPCSNPGFGCRSGCGGAKNTNCVAPYSLE